MNNFFDRISAKYRGYPAFRRLARALLLLAAVLGLLFLTGRVFIHFGWNRNEKLMKYLLPPFNLLLVLTGNHLLFELIRFVRSISALAGKSRSLTVQPWRLLIGLPFLLVGSMTANNVLQSTMRAGNQIALAIAAVIAILGAVLVLAELFSLLSQLLLRRFGKRCEAYITQVTADRLSMNGRRRFTARCEGDGLVFRVKTFDIDYWSAIGARVPVLYWSAFPRCCMVLWNELRPAAVPDMEQSEEAES